MLPFQLVNWKSISYFKKQTHQRQLSNFKLQSTVLFSVSFPFLISMSCYIFLEALLSNLLYATIVWNEKPWKGTKKSVTCLNLLRRGPFESRIPPAKLDWAWIDHDFVLWVCTFYFPCVLLHFGIHHGPLSDFHRSMSGYQNAGKKKLKSLKRHIYPRPWGITHQFSLVIVRIQSHTLERSKEFNCISYRLIFLFLST